MKYYVCMKAYNNGGCSDHSTTTDQWAKCKSCGSAVVLVKSNEIER